MQKIVIFIYLKIYLFFTQELNIFTKNIFLYPFSSLFLPLSLSPPTSQFPYSLTYPNLYIPSPPSLSPTPTQPPFCRLILKEGNLLIYIHEPFSKYPRSLLHSPPPSSSFSPPSSKCPVNIHSDGFSISYDSCTSIK